MPKNIVRLNVYIFLRRGIHLNSGFVLTKWIIVGVELNLMRESTAGQVGYKLIRVFICACMYDVVSWKGRLLLRRRSGLIRL